MRTSQPELSAPETVITAGYCLCDEADGLLALNPLEGRDAIEFDAVCQRLIGLTRLLAMDDWEKRLEQVRESLLAPTLHKRLRRASKQTRKAAVSSRDREATRRAAEAVDEDPELPIATDLTAAWVSLFRELRAALPAARAEADVDAMWLRCRRDYGRVRSMGSAWRDGEARIGPAVWAAALRGVYCQLTVLAPLHAIDAEKWEKLLRSLEDRDALEQLHGFLLRNSGRISPSYIISRSITILETVGRQLDLQAAEGHAACFEGRPRSYFASLRPG